MGFDTLSLQVFTDVGSDASDVTERVASRVSGFLTAYPAERVVSIIPQVVASANFFCYTVTVTLRG